MDRWYDVRIVLDAAPTEKNIRRILERAVAINELKAHENIQAIKWSLDEGVQRAIYKLHNLLEAKGLHVIRGESNCYFYCVSRGNFLAINASPEPIYIEKSSTSETSLDWDLYIQLILDICKDFALREISTEDTYYNESVMLYQELQEKRANALKDITSIATIDEDYNATMSLAIIERSVQMGCVYFDYYKDEKTQKINKILSPAEVVRKLEACMNPTAYNIHLCPKGLYKNLAFSLAISDQGDKAFKLLMTPIGTIPYIKGENDSFIDFDPYIRLQLDICKDYLIIEFKTSQYTFLPDTYGQSVRP